MRIITGFTPSGPLHLGALLAVIEPLRNQDAQSLVFVSDLHALTSHHDPREVAQRRTEFAMLLIACGLDQSTLFMQSSVPEMTGLHYLLECTATYGEVSRMVQFKEKSSAQGNRGVRMSLMSYPVLMAADILGYGITHVPVGEDQLQHLELARTIARRFNSTYGDTFVVPEPIVNESVARVMDLSDPKVKMSKSNPSQTGVLRLLDSPDEIKRKIARAVTDTEGSVRHDPEAKPAVSNLLEILAHLRGEKPSGINDLKDYAALKSALADAVIDRLTPIQRRYAELQRGRSGVEHRLTEGAKRARGLAAPILAAAQSAMGVGVVI